MFRWTVYLFLCLVLVGSVHADEMLLVVVSENKPIQYYQGCGIVKAVENFTGRSDVEFWAVPYSCMMFKNGRIDIPINTIRSVGDSIEVDNPDSMSVFIVEHEKFERVIKINGALDSLWVIGRGKYLTRTRRDSLVRALSDSIKANTDPLIGLRSWNLSLQTTVDSLSALIKSAGIK